MHGHTDGQAADLDGNPRNESSFDGQHLTEKEKIFCRNLPLLAFQWDSEIQDGAFLTRLMRLMTAERSEIDPQLLRSGSHSKFPQSMVLCVADAVKTICCVSIQRQRTDLDTPVDRVRSRHL